METEQSKKITTVEEKSNLKDNKPIKVMTHSLFRLWMSRKLWMTSFGLGMLYFAYWREVNYLYSFQTPEHITAFTSITRDFMFAFTTAVLAYLGVSGVTEWKHGTTSVINQAASFVKEQKDQKIENIQHIIEEGKPGAPAVKPFSGNAVE